MQQFDARLLRELEELIVFEARELYDVDLSAMLDKYKTDIDIEEVK